MIGVKVNFHTWEQSQILAAGFLGGRGALKLACILADAVPCPQCDYIHNHCKCREMELSGFILGEN